MTLRFGFRHSLAGSPVGLAETGSLYYGLVVLLQLLPTSGGAASLPRRRRSYFRIQAGECLPEEDLHLSDQTTLNTH